jgi:RNA-directed DNA polymerase
MARNGGKPMNDNNSMTEKSERLSDTKRLAQQWAAVDWRKAEEYVNRLQIRIAKATQNSNWGLVKRLQYLLTHSYYAKLLAVIKVTTNKGKNTSGIDKELWGTPASKMKAVLTLTDKHYKAKPLRRVYIDKKGKKAKRPLGIPCMYDRAMQALYAMALEPVAEMTADTKSFGFRKERCCQDACEYIFTALSRSFCAEWVLEGDIKGCFDHISHEWLLENIPMDKTILKQFLKAGFVFKRDLFPTEEGTPQGGIISPILANMALDGIQKMLVDKFHTNKKGKVDYRFKNAHKVNLVRYADDFIVTAATKEIAEEVKGLIRDFLKIRGLELSEEKTVITHINDGFDFLGWNFKKYKGKLIVKPSKKSVQSFKDKLSETILQKGKAWKQDLLIEKLNQQIRGWTNYHQSVCASEAFSHIDYILFELLWKWAKHRHPHKGKWWISTNYWHRVGNREWVFSTDDRKLLRLDHIPIVRHTKIRENANVYFDTDYFKERKFNNGMKRLSGRFKLIWKNQNGCCYHCGMPMDIHEDREIFFKVPKSQGGSENVKNMAYVHSKCQRYYNECRSKE